MSGERRAYRQRFYKKNWRGHKPDTGPVRDLAARCGRVLACDGRFERGGEPGDPGRPPVCGRPAGHRGPCRSEAALARYQRADLVRQAAARQERARAA